MLTNNLAHTVPEVWRFGIWEPSIADVELDASSVEYYNLSATESVALNNIQASRSEMHDFYHQRLLNDATKFNPRTGNRFLEILDSGVRDMNLVAAHQKLICIVGRYSGYFPRRRNSRDRDMRLHKPKCEFPFHLYADNFAYTSGSKGG